MTNLNLSLAQPKQLAVIHTMLAGTFLSRAGYFMVWPYLSVELYRQFQLSALQIGAIFFMTLATGTLIGVFVSYYSDKLGRERSLIASLFLSIIGFASMAYSDCAAEFVGSMLLISTGRACTESFSKAMIGDYLTDFRQREQYQYIRYYVVNIGSALGPLAGTYALASPVINVFFASSVIYLIYALALIFILKGLKEREISHKKKIPSFANSVSKIFLQTQFSKLIICYFIVMFVYTSFDSPLIQLLTRLKFPDLNYAISVIFLVNAITVIVFQYPVLFLLKRWSIKGKVILGITLISLSQLLFLTVYSGSLGLLAFSVFVLSIGELITMPAFSVEVDRLAPAELRGTSFGLINLTSLGTALCPLFCGFFIDAGLGYLMFATLFILGVISISIYASVGQRKSAIK
ncbi:MFS transporter [Serratia plymuthica]|uniref:MFS transporter n=1 Tax=Serratia plymuthica TaxID=82996 RepID=UPI00201DBDFE|nr:MFS transporter [Serratia plymuthica]